VSYVDQLFDLANEGGGGTLGLDRHANVKEAAVGGGIGIQADQLEAAATRHAENAQQGAFFIVYAQLECERFH
jgi:hypothetical protein